MPPGPMHALSLPTWWIHVTSVLEWVIAIAAVQAFGLARAGGGLALAGAGHAAGPGAAPWPPAPVTCSTTAPR